MPRYSGIAKTSIGSSHLKNDKECQDTSGYMNSLRFHAALVSDGHGGDKHFRSAVGSALIKKVCKDSLLDFSKTVYKKKEKYEVETIFKWFAKYLLYSWREDVNRDIEQNPIEQDERLNKLTPKEVETVKKNPYIAYGATLLLAIYSREFLYILQLGDGDIRIHTKRGIENPIQEDNCLMFGRTTSLCNSDALDHVRMTILPSKSVRGCFLSSDGVRNSFDSEESYIKFIRVVLSQLEDRNNTLDEDLNDFLPKLSSEGSGDDVSVAAIVRK